MNQEKKTILLLANHSGDKWPDLGGKLQKIGYDVLHSQNAIDTLAFLKENDPEILVLKLSADPIPDYELSAIEEAITPWQEIILLLKNLPKGLDKKPLLNRIGDFYTGKNRDELLSRVELAHARLEVKTTYRQQLKVLEEQSTTDYKTGIYNDRYIFRRLMEEFQRSSRHGHALSIIMIDLDGFKTLNDTQGHTFGDFVLQAFAKHLSSMMRNIDIPGRYGGDEFLLLLPNTNIEEAKVIADRLRLFLENHTFEKNNQRARITVSQGVNTYHGEGDVTCEQFLKGADRAAFEAKKQGRNKVCLYPDLPSRRKG
jgi:diguanylate cyclase (GGDEF)-like protein